MRLTEVDVVIPSVGRPSLRVLVEALDAAGASPCSVTVVDDRRDVSEPLPMGIASVGSVPIRTLRSGGRGPAAARNVGASVGAASWIVFLDDDVVVRSDWADRLDDDIRRAGVDVAGVQGRVVVPLPRHRRPTDWERNVACLEDARWISADLAVRRDAFEEIGGFDERFRRAYREDSDLALRLIDDGWRIDMGSRVTVHPVREATRWVSIGAQRGNADDALMRRLHGRHYRQRLGERSSVFAQHAVTVLAGAVALIGTIGRRRWRWTALMVWLALTTVFARRRILAGPRDPAEVAAMAVTSAVIPPVACAHRLLGEIRARSVA